MIFAAAIREAPGKVFQSLCGYDFMLLDQNLDEPASETFESLRAAFWEEVMLDNWIRLDRMG